MTGPYRHNLNIEMRPLSDLTPWARNPRSNDKAAERLAYTIAEHGWTNPILLDRTGQIVAGHTRFKAAMKLGLSEVPTIQLDVEGHEAAAIAIADNRLAEMAEWDGGELAALLDELDGAGLDLDAIGYDSDELGEALAAMDAPERPEAPDPEELPEDPDSRLGEVYELGPHRLVCGDSTKSKAIKALLMGELIDAVWTDPPYGVSYVGKTKDALTIENDSLDEGQLRTLLDAAFGVMTSNCKPGAPWYVAAPAGPLFAVFGAALSAIDIWRHTLVWAKDAFVLGRCDYHYRHEAIFYGWMPGGAHPWIGGRAEDSIIECPRPRVNKEHPTMKPPELIQTCLLNHLHPNVQKIVFDPFGGSGSTLMAAALNGWSARLAEIDPKYCDVIRKRWTAWAEEAGEDAGSGALR